MTFLKKTILLLDNLQICGYTGIPTHLETTSQVRQLALGQ